MTIDNPKLYLASIWDWGFLNHVFSPTRIRLSDWDGYLENDGVKQKHGYVHREHGHHLLFETKTHVLHYGPLDPPPEMSRATEKSHSELVKVGFSIVYLWGTPNVFPVPRVRVWKEFADAPAPDHFDVTERWLVEMVRAWFAYANRNPLKLSEVQKILKSQIKRPKP